MSRHGADTRPGADTPPPPGKGTHPPPGTRYTPPRSRHTPQGANTPLPGADIHPSRHPPGTRYTLGADTPQSRHPPPPRNHVISNLLRYLSKRMVGYTFREHYHYATRTLLNYSPRASLSRLDSYCLIEPEMGSGYPVTSTIPAL